MDSIRSFTQLTVWKKGHLLVLHIYEVTKGFPKREAFGLTSQIQRAAVSITSNIAEGFSRRTRKDKSHFYTMATGSNTELQNQLLIARDLTYIDKEKFLEIASLSIEVGKMLNALIHSVSS